MPWHHSWKEDCKVKSNKCGQWKKQKSFDWSSHLIDMNAMANAENVRLWKKHMAIYWKWNKKGLVEVTTIKAVERFLH